MGIIKTFIDDKVAEEDVRQLNRAKENLNNSMTKLNNISRELEGYSGNSVQVLLENVNELKIALAKAIEDVEQNKSDIRKTISKYKEADKKVKNQIENSISK